MQEGERLAIQQQILLPLDRVVLPADGVYVVDVEHDGQMYRGMASASGKMSLSKAMNYRFEANILIFTRYLWYLFVFWLDKIRDMVKFDNNGRASQAWLQVDKGNRKILVSKNRKH